jgi:hypothetical protein
MDEILQDALTAIQQRDGAAEATPGPPPALAPRQQELPSRNLRSRIEGLISEQAALANAWDEEQVRRVTVLLLDESGSGGAPLRFHKAGATRESSSRPWTTLLSGNAAVCRRAPDTLANAEPALSPGDRFVGEAIRRGSASA